MYLQYFGLREKPFNMTPDSDFLYLRPACEDILSGMTLGIRERTGLIGLLGETGSGKTMLINALLEKLDKKTKRAFIFNFSTGVSFNNMLTAALEDLGVIDPRENLPMLEAIQRFQNFALEQLFSGGNVLLIVDEAQNLDHKAMENLRLLSNLETRKHKLVQILLVGSTELEERLDSQEFRQINDRLTCRFYLPSLTKQEIKSYIHHRLSMAGNNGKVHMSDGAVGAIYQYSSGNPRKINSVCDRALIIAYCSDQFVISKKIAMKAIVDLEGPNGKQYPSNMRMLLSRMVPVAAGILIGVTIASVAGERIGDRFLRLFSPRSDISAIERGTLEESATASHVFRQEIVSAPQQLAKKKGKKERDTPGTDTDRASLFMQK